MNGYRKGGACKQWEIIQSQKGGNSVICDNMDDSECTMLSEIRQTGKDNPLGSRLSVEPKKPRLIKSIGWWMPEVGNGRNE